MAFPAPPELIVRSPIEFARPRELIDDIDDSLRTSPGLDTFGKYEPGNGRLADPCSDEFEYMDWDETSVPEDEIGMGGDTYGLP